MLQRDVYLIVKDTKVKVYFWNANFMCSWTLAEICIALVAPLALTIGDVVHEVRTCQSLAVPTCGEDNFNLQFGTPTCRETGSFIALTCVDRLTVFGSPLARALTTAVKRNTRLGPTALPRNHLESGWKCKCSRCPWTRGAPDQVG